ncbi:MAG TPA: T9SS type A sorting domain-containing protein, partial [Cryomorphaceae bacterium]|nr:T9SS type A sorting domain-containing protein [Cryomorphaceae bacterium]
KSQSVRTSIVDTYSLLNDNSKTLAITETSKGDLIIKHPLKGKVTVKIKDLRGTAFFALAQTNSKEVKLGMPEVSGIESGIYLVELDDGSEKVIGQWIKR